MMLTMTRLPSDSFLPSGAVLDPHERSMPYAAAVNGHSTTSVISPLSLPHAANHFSYFEDSQLTQLPPPNYSHPPALPGAPRPHQYLSPDPSPPAIRGHRSTSRSPTRYRTSSPIASPNMPPTSHPTMASPLLSMSGQSVANLLQRKEEHHRKVIENMNAERAHLEANRVRAEECFAEERTLMDDERQIWAEEKAKLETDAFEWKRRAEAAEAENARLVKTIQSLQGKAGPSSILDGAADAKDSTRGASDSGRSGRASAVKFRSPTDGRSPGSRGTTMPESQPFEPLDPRMQTASPGDASPSEGTNIPSIDVHEVMPGLEGIRLKATAVKRPTFLDGTTSPPDTESKKGAPSSSQIESSPSGKPKASPADRTKAALLAPESHRLTMHAGHTPNHSISLSRLQTVNPTKAPNTADSSGTSTPTRQPETAREQSSESNAVENIPAPQATGVETEQDADPAPMFEPSDGDHALKGPLHLKNRPAVDEPFLEALNQRLEAAQNSDEILPTVVRRASQESQQARQDPQVLEAQKPEPTATLGTDGASDPQEQAIEDVEEIEEEIPLKFKNSSNFGQPLGRIGNASGI
ncbi:hypothetical protein F4778DRAFT_701462 [Xylariomycetidae sp. FL2044]|nr:hypothetical protein F4778DRAFT_701462 [Xylariomycetidae sp. FL2044]